SGGQQFEFKLFAIDDYGVTGVISAIWFNDVVNTTAEQVGCFAFALVAPLGTHDCDCWHKISSLPRRPDKPGPQHRKVLVPSTLVSGREQLQPEFTKSQCIPLFAKARRRNSARPAGLISCSNTR